jgi:hypothetical protein
LGWNKVGIESPLLYYLSGVFFDLFTPKNRAARDLFSAHLPGNFFGSKLGIPSQKLTFQHEFAAKNRCWQLFQPDFPAKNRCWLTAITANGYIEQAESR